MLEMNVQKRLTDANGRSFDLDLSFAAASPFTVVTGPSGAGKSSMLQMIAGIIRPDSGSIKLNDRTFFDSSRSTNLSIQERRVGFVFQDYALFPHMTAFENVAFGIPGADRSAKADELLETFHIGHVRGRRPHEMSGGEQQRTALARAIATEPSIMLLDEPLSAVDVETRSHLLGEIEAAQSRTGIPFIYVTHNEAEANRFGGAVLRIENGRTMDQKKLPNGSLS